MPRTIAQFAPDNFFPAATTNFAAYNAVTFGGAFRSALSFDPATSERMRSQAFKIPQGAVFPLTAVVTFAIAATTGNVAFRLQIEAITPGDNINVNTTNSYDTANSSGAVSVPATTFNPKDFTINITNADNAAIGDICQITLDRDISVASNATGDCYILFVEIRDASI